MLMRLNFSMGLVCMTGTTAKEVEGAIKGEFDWDSDTIANLLAAFYYGNIITQMLGGYLGRVFGERYPLMVCMSIIAALELLLPSLARWSPWALFSARILMGLASGPIFPLIYSLITVWASPAEKATLLGIAFTGYSFSSIFNYPVSSLLCLTGIDNGWPLIFYVPDTTAVVWVIAFYFITSDSPEAHPRISMEEKTYLKHNSCKKSCIGL